LEHIWLEDDSTDDGSGVFGHGVRPFSLISGRYKGDLPGESARQIEVLLIEDDPSDAELITTLLAKCQTRFNVTRVDRLGMATAILRGRSEIDLVLLDFSLPDSEGIETFERVQAVASTLPIIVLTSTKDDKLASDAVRRGAQDHLVKAEIDQKLIERSIHYSIARKAAEQALRESEERFSLAVEGASDGVWDWDLRTDRIYFSDRYGAMLGWRWSDYPKTGLEWFATIHPDDLPVVEEAISAHLAGGTPRLAIEYRTRHCDGSHRWILARGLAVRDQSGRPCRMAGILTEVTNRKRAEEELAYSAFHDSLTGLPNRALFLDRLDQLMAQSRRRGKYSYAVLFMDLDHFKNINDNLGHSVGDRLLITIAHSLQAFVRQGDTMARLGGDEFAMLAHDVSERADMCRLAERLLDRLREPFQVGEHQILTSASVGIAAGAAYYEHPEEILRDADTAMYRAKARGRARYEIFDATMHRRPIALLALQSELRRALKQNEFAIQFQPIVNLRSMTLYGFEALIRWRHPVRGLLKPDDFIPIAEETGVIGPIGEWVLREACRHAREWRELNSSILVSVNLSPRELLDPNIVDTVANILAETKTDPSALILELTEGALSQNPGGVAEKLVRLRDLGVKIYIDNFGTGYSSLTHLQRLPCDTLKIDGSFVKCLGANTGSGEMVQAIMALARNLGKQVCAEGIETRRQLQELSKLGCDLGQGFWFSAPLESGEALALIGKGNAFFQRVLRQRTSPRKE